MIGDIAPWPILGESRRKSKSRCKMTIHELSAEFRNNFSAIRKHINPAHTNDFIEQNRHVWFPFYWQNKERIDNKMVSLCKCNKNGARVPEEKVDWFSTSYLQLCLGNIDFSFVNEFNDKFQIRIAHVLRHYYRRMFARIFQQQFLEIRRTRGQHHLKRNNKIIIESDYAIFK